MDTLWMLCFALILVLVAALLFVNALEYLGERMGVSEGVTGSIFAAVGTAMPETIVPLVAILAGGASLEMNHAIGLGAILGAPFMLATLALGLLALFAGLKRGWTTTLKPEPTGLQRDLCFFMVGFGVVVGAAMLPSSWLLPRTMIAIFLLCFYAFYLYRTIQASQSLVQDGHETVAHHDLYVGFIPLPQSWMAVLQLLLALGLLIWGAKIFVFYIEVASVMLGISALLVSLLLVPFATELPEKMNSILWVRRGKDTLAFGNITGAMVFQGTVIPAVAMLLMPWLFSDVYAVVAVFLAFSGAFWLLFLRKYHILTPLYLLIANVFYAAFILFVLIL
ncbi:MAG: sodium:calcium antiporter [Mariprofundaceae bacterium]|nr:sodium:calcium antiporter [Mariprofundaceae bacterium]